MNESQRTGRLRLRHLLEVTEAKDEEMCEARERFARLAEPSSAPRVVSSFNLFQSPEPLASQLVEILGRTGRTLEPSAGLGRIYRAIRSADSSNHITLVDNSADCCRELYLATATDPDCRLIQGDFLAQSPKVLGLFDCIVMNPPFRGLTYVKHILHAWEFLAPGGRLVSVTATNFVYRQDSLSQLFRAFISDNGSYSVNDKNAFAESGTNVETAIIMVNKAI